MGERTTHIAQCVWCTMPAAPGRSSRQGRWQSRPQDHYHWTVKLPPSPCSPAACAVPGLRPSTAGGAAAAAGVRGGGARGGGPGSGGHHRQLQGGRPSVTRGDSSCENSTLGLLHRVPIPCSAGSSINRAAQRHAACGPSSCYRSGCCSPNNGVALPCLGLTSDACIRMHHQLTPDVSRPAPDA